MGRTFVLILLHLPLISGGFMFATLILAALLGQTPVATMDPYAPLRLYDGSWTVTMHDATSGKTTTDSLLNACHFFGKYFACQQTVNGKVGALVVFVPRDTPGHYYTQPVLPDGSATGRSELTIELTVGGSHWVYLGHDEENGKTTWYRTTNDFTGTDRIHFEQATSPDGEAWTVTGSGDEVHGIASKP